VLGKNIDFGPIVCGYIGMMLLGATYSAIGIFGSSLTSNQIVSFIISFFIVFFFFILEYSLIFIPAGLAGFFQYLSVGYHFQNLARGVLDTRDLIYFISLNVIFLRLSTVVLEMRKWK
jgi:ABC-2 type transport system permease protein